MNKDCVFCRIVAGEIPAEIVHRGERVVAFKDLNPVADTHVLVVPLDHHQDVVELAAADPDALQEIPAVGAKVSEEAGHEGFRLLFNTGAAAGQSVFHAHAHVLAGHFRGWPE